MKKLLLALVLVAGTFFCNAQVFLGGNIGFDMKSGDAIPTTTAIEFNPFGGYMFAKTLGAGLDLGIGMTNAKEVTDLNLITITTNLKTTTWRVAPFFRWVFGNFERVKLYADAKVNLEGGSEKAVITGGDDEGTINGNKAFSWGVAVVPGIKFMLNNHISMNGKLNLLSLGYSQTSVTGPEEDATPVKTNTFGLGVNGKTAITVGFIYTF